MGAFLSISLSLSVSVVSTQLGLHFWKHRKSLLGVSDGRKHDDKIVYNLSLVWGGLQLVLKKSTRTSSALGKCCNIVWPFNLVVGHPDPAQWWCFRCCATQRSVWRVSDLRLWLNLIIVARWSGHVIVWWTMRQFCNATGSNLSNFEHFSH